VGKAKERMNMCQVVLSLGSNYQQEKYLPQAFTALSDIFGELLFSPVYESAAINPSATVNADSERWYYNVVVGFDSDKTVTEIQQIIHEIEDACARDRARQRVNIDIDLLLYGDVAGKVDGVVLPRADILTCAYVLRPLSDIFPDRLHPVLQQSFIALWQSFCEKSKLISRLQPVDFVWRGQVISIAPSCLIM
jgi:2-amino-4-hydroxy-6-hydroxymethyldihydropteridine diphosphokinase